MNMTETNLKRVFLDYGELKNAPVLARTIVEAREVQLRPLMN
jgi:16S rRNA (cytosine1402-N4)-methyltransferase